jgi:hypothetical protein
VEKTTPSAAVMAARSAATANGLYRKKPQLIVTIRKDITNVLPNIRRHGLAVVEHMKYSGLYSRSYLRKAGLLPNKWKKPGLGWKRHP